MLGELQPACSTAAHKDTKLWSLQWACSQSWDYLVRTRGCYVYTDGCVKLKREQFVHCTPVHTCCTMLQSCRLKLPLQSSVATKILCNMDDSPIRIMKDRGYHCLMNHITFFEVVVSLWACAKVRLRNHFRNNTARKLHPPYIWITLSPSSKNGKILWSRKPTITHLSFKLKF